MQFLQFIKKQFASPSRTELLEEQLKDFEAQAAANYKAAMKLIKQAEHYDTHAQYIRDELESLAIQE